MMIAESRQKAAMGLSPGALSLSLLVALACLPIGGCAVGPDFKKPAAPPVSDYTPAPLSTTESTPDVTGGEAQRFTKGGDIGGDWWTLYQSPALESLIAQALKNNSDLKAAQAALKSAHESALAGRGAYYPQLGLTASAFHYQQPGTLAPVPSNNAFQYSSSMTPPEFKPSQCISVVDAYNSGRTRGFVICSC